MPSWWKARSAVVSMGNGVEASKVSATVSAATIGWRRSCPLESYAHAWVITNGVRYRPSGAESNQIPLLQVHLKPFRTGVSQMVVGCFVLCGQVGPVRKCMSLCCRQAAAWKEDCCTCVVGSAFPTCGVRLWSTAFPLSSRPARLVGVVARTIGDRT